MFGTGQAKGSVLLHLREYMIRSHGDAAWQETRSSLVDEDRDVIDGIIISGGWYPVRVWNHCLDTYLLKQYEDPDEGMRKVARFIADRDLNSVYKMVLRLGSPEFLVKRTNSLWSRYFSKGEMQAFEVGDASWRIVLAAPSAKDSAPGYFTCGPGVCAWIEHGLRLTGAHASVEHVRCRLEEGVSCEYRVKW